MRRLFPRAPLVIALFAASAPWALSQAAVSAHFPAASKPATASMQGVRGLPPREGFSAFRRLQGRNPNRLPFFPFGLFSDALLSDNPPSAQSPESPASPSAMDLIAALSALGRNPEPAPPPAQPLLIELRGDRYVRLSNADIAENPRDSGEPVRVTASAVAPFAHSTGSAVSRPVRELPPVSLIFRDGHSEQVNDYSIVGGVMYARGDFYTDGYWNKTIELTSIDVPATLKANNDRSVKFVLPSSPNEVVTRP